ncbi:hypothetical protein [Streptomyces vinaceus]|uniref:hypothetical protein n=1 Tax=Streptomyces vinaceus TaxID=1960 RepID=UPI0036B56F16
MGAARELVGLPCPVLVLPGSHDRRGPFRAGLLGAAPDDGELNRAVFLLCECGHAHAAAGTTFAGRPLLVASGVVSTVPLPFEGRPVVDHELPPAPAFHVRDDRRRPVTHHRAPGPWPPVT